MRRADHHRLVVVGDHHHAGVDARRGEQRAQAVQRGDGEAEEQQVGEDYQQQAGRGRKA